MHPLLWLFATGVLEAAIYLSSTGEGDLTVLGWFLAAIGWGVAAAMSALHEDTLDAWSQVDRRRRER